MKTAIAFLVLGIIVLAAAWFYFPVRISPTSVEMTYGDTHVTVDRTTLTIAVISFLGLLFTVGGLVGTGFRNRFFLYLLLIIVIGAAYFLITFYA